MGGRACAFAVAFFTATGSTGLAAEADGDRADLARWLVFSSISVASDGAYFGSGARRAFRGAIDRSGWISALDAGAGFYSYKPGSRLPGTVIGFVEWRSAMLGYQHFRPGFGVTALGGVDYQRHKHSQFDAGNPVRGRRYGVKAQIQLWAKPASRLLLSASASLSSVFRSYDLRAGLALQLYRSLALGPEIGICGNKESVRSRFGLRLDGIKVRSLTFALAGGAYASHKDFADAVGARNVETGLYGTLSLQRKF